MPLRSSQGSRSGSGKQESCEPHHSALSHSALGPFSFSTHTHGVYTDVNDFLCIIMSLLKIKFPQPGISAPSSSFFISLANSCISLVTQVKSLMSLVPTELVCFDFTLLLCLCPFGSFSASLSHPAIRNSQSGLLWALFVLFLLFWSPASLSSLHLFPGSPPCLCAHDPHKHLLPTFQRSESHQMP